MDGYGLLVLALCALTFSAPALAGAYVHSRSRWNPLATAMLLVGASLLLLAVVLAVSAFVTAIPETSSGRLYVLALGALTFSAPVLLVAYVYRDTRWRTFRIATASAGGLLAGLALALWITGLANRPPCLESHTESGIQPMQVGDITIMMPTEYEICDRRAPEKPR